MKKIVVLLTIIVIFPLLCIKSSADERVDGYLSDFESALPDELTDELESPESLGDAVGFRALLAEILNIANGSRGRVLSFFGVLLGSALLMALASSVSGSASSAVGVICSSLIFSTVSEIFTSVALSLEEINEFFSSLIPIAVGVTALGGGVASASALGGGMMLTLSVIGRFLGPIFSSVCGVGLAMSLLTAFGNSGVEAVGRGVRNLFMWLVGITTALITGTLALQTLIGTASDGTAMRAARYAASGMIPVVGSTVSGALSTLAAGLTYAKSFIGVGAILVIVTFALSPLIMLLLYRFALSAVIIFSDFVGIGGGTKIFSAYRFVIDSVVTLYALSALVYVLEIILFIKCGVAVL